MNFTNDELKWSITDLKKRIKQDRELMATTQTSKFTNNLFKTSNYLDRKPADLETKVLQRF